MPVCTPFVPVQTVQHRRARQVDAFEVSPGPPLIWWGASGDTETELSAGVQLADARIEYSGTDVPHGCVMRIGMRIGMRIDMCLDMCVDITIDGCIDLCADVRIDMGIDMRTDMHIELCAHM